MTSDSSRESVGAESSSTAVEPSRLEAVERAVLDRRRFLTGLGVGAVAVGSVSLGVTRLPDEFGSQSLATLAGDAVVPAATTHYLPAVDGTGQGQIITVRIEFTDRREGLFVNLNGIELRHDLQVALREAVVTARELTGERPPEDGVLVSFTAAEDGLVALRGKSWEAGLTVGLAAALAGRSPDPETLVTGVVADDGTLLPVGSIVGKAQAAREFGASRLLVPEEQEQQIPGIAVEGVARIDQATSAVLDR